MHTFLERNGTYFIGSWLPNIEGRTSFVSLFEVGSSLTEAINAVNVMNGGNAHGRFVARALKD